MLLDACFSFFSAHATAVHPCHAPGAQMSRALWMALAENYARFRAESLRKQQEWAEQSLQQTADDKKRRYILALRHELRYRQKNLGKPLTFQSRLRPQRKKPYHARARSPSARVESTRAKIVNADLFDEPVRIVEPPQAKRKKMTAQLPSGPAIVYMLHDADIAEDIAVMVRQRRMPAPYRARMDSP
eukprot:m.399864 g.399864  ORF g.399864 m.399864 type:complete len:187 (+) comp56437_c0_seq18:62-622(+)